MTRKEYTISFDKAEKSEKYIRKFLLDISDTIRLTEHQWAELGFFKVKKFWGEENEKYLSILNALKPFFIKKITNNKKYNDIKQFKKSRFTHYLYKLSPKLKIMLNKETLLWHDGLSQSYFMALKTLLFIVKE